MHTPEQRCYLEARSFVENDFFPEYSYVLSDNPIDPNGDDDFPRTVEVFVYKMQRALWSENPAYMKEVSCILEIEHEFKIFSVGPVSITVYEKR